MNESLAVIIVNYNSALECLNLIDEILKKTRISNKQIFLINNGSTDDSNDLFINNISSEINYVNNRQNSGFSGGVNIALKKITKKNFKYTLLLNSDIKFYDDFVEPLIHVLENDLKIGVVGPVIKNNSNNLFEIGGKINMYTGKVIMKTTQNLNKNFNTSVDWIVGAVMMFKNELIQEIGYFPEEYFLNYEETEWQFLVRKLGWKVCIVPNIVVEHDVHKSIDKIDNLQLYFMLRNKLIFESRNGNLLQKIFFFGTNHLRIWKLKMKLKESGSVVNLAVKDSKTGENSFLDGRLRKLNQIKVNSLK